MSKNFYNTLWRITALVAVGLLIATFILVYQAVNLPQTGLQGKLTGSNPTIYLRAEPSGSGKIVTILERGTTVNVIDTSSNQNIIWIHIKAGSFTGWVPQANIIFESYWSDE